MAESIRNKCEHLLNNSNLPKFNVTKLEIEVL